ncbi:MAG: MFS transporter, partial [Bacteroidia bacterium]
GSDSTDAFFLFCIPVIVFYARLYIKANDSERQPLGTMFTIFLVVILFWAIFKQNGTALTTYAEQYTVREIPETVSGLAKNLGFAETLKYTKDSVWAKDQFFRKLKHDGKPYKVLD